MSQIKALEDGKVSNLVVGVQRHKSTKEKDKNSKMVNKIKPITILPNFDRIKNDKISSVNIELSNNNTKAKDFHHKDESVNVAVLASKFNNNFDFSHNYHRPSFRPKSADVLNNRKKKNISHGTEGIHDQNSFQKAKGIRIPNIWTIGNTLLLKSDYDTTINNNHNHKNNNNQQKNDKKERNVTKEDKEKTKESPLSLRLNGKNKCPTIVNVPVTSSATVSSPSCSPLGPSPRDKEYGWDGSFDPEKISHNRYEAEDRLYSGIGNIARAPELPIRPLSPRVRSKSASYTRRANKFVATSPSPTGHTFTGHAATDHNDGYHAAHIMPKSENAGTNGTSLTAHTPMGLLSQDADADIDYIGEASIESDEKKVNAPSIPDTAKSTDISIRSDMIKDIMRPTTAPQEAVDIGRVDTSDVPFDTGLQELIVDVSTSALSIGTAKESVIRTTASVADNMSAMPSLWSMHGVPTGTEDTEGYHDVNRPPPLMQPQPHLQGLGNAAVGLAIGTPSNDEKNISSALYQNTHGSKTKSPRRKKYPYYYIKHGLGQALPGGGTAVNVDDVATTIGSGESEGLRSPIMTAQNAENWDLRVDFVSESSSPNPNPISPRKALSPRTAGTSRYSPRYDYGNSNSRGHSPDYRRIRTATQGERTVMVEVVFPRVDKIMLDHSSEFKSTWSNGDGGSGSGSGEYHNTSSMQKSQDPRAHVRTLQMAQSAELQLFSPTKVSSDDKYRNPQNKGLGEYEGKGVEEKQDNSGRFKSKMQKEVSWTYVRQAIKGGEGQNTIVEPVPAKDGIGRFVKRHVRQGQLTRAQYVEAAQRVVGEKTEAHISSKEKNVHIQSNGKSSYITGLVKKAHINMKKPPIKKVPLAIALNTVAVGQGLETTAQVK